MTTNLERAPQYREQAATLLRASEREADARQKAQWIEIAALYYELAKRLEDAHHSDAKPKE